MRHCIVKTMLFATENKNAPCCDRADPVQQGNITRGMRLHMFQVTLTLPRIMPRQNSLPYYEKLVLMQSTSNRIKTSLSHAAKLSRSQWSNRTSASYSIQESRPAPSA